MIKTLLIFLSFTLVHFCHCNEINYRSLNSIEEAIALETLSISNASSAEQLSDAYASRGESLLLCNRFEEALSDFQNAYTFAISINDKDTSQSSVFRALFDQALTYGNLNILEMVISTTDALKEIMHAAQCNDCEESKLSLKTVSRSKKNRASPPPIIRCSENVPIYGPDQISKRDCVDFIDSTISLAKLLIYKAPPAARGVLTLTLDQLGNQAARCCNAGGIWKGCVQKLCNKYHLWNQKWQVFGIPPDPAWD